MPCKPSNGPLIERTGLVGQEKVQGQLSLDKNSKKITDNELYKELLKLNFSQQYIKCSKSLEDKAADLIMLCGKKDNGIAMLGDKIVNPHLNPQENQDQISINPLPVIELNGSEGIISSNDVWEKLATCVESYEKKTFLEDEIKAKITGACRERSIVIIFKIDNEIHPEWLKEIIDNVCKPLLNSANQQSSEQSKRNKLLMLFLDYQEQFSKIEDQQICKITTTSFDKNDIECWMINAEQQFTQSRLPTAFSFSEADKIYSDSREGNPRLVYKNIYQLFDITWPNSEVHRRVG